MKTANSESSRSQLPHPKPPNPGFQVGRPYAHLLSEMETRFPESSRYLNHERLRSMDLEAVFGALAKMDLDGFAHDAIAGHYGNQQLRIAKALTRSQGYLALARLLQRSQRWGENHVLLDALAGNGTFDRVMQHLMDERPKYIGNDVSLAMVQQAHRDNRLVFCSDLHEPIIKTNFADYAICAYGTHHVPPASRSGFIAAIRDRVKPGGTLVVQDFLEGSATARWYSECIHQFRTHGHDCRHFARGELTALLRDAGLVNVTEHTIYDPFVVALDVDRTFPEARALFYDDLIELFALDRLRRIVDQEHLSLCTLDNLLSPYFKLEQIEVGSIQSDSANGVHTLPIESTLTVKIVNGTNCLIAPRMAIAAVGTCT